MSSELAIARDLVVKERIVHANPQRGDLSRYRLYLGTLESDAHTIVSLPNFGDVGLVQKRRPYVEGPADLMLVPFYRPVDLLTHCSPDEARELFFLSGHLIGVLSSLQLNGFPVIAINQQPEAGKIASKYAPDGTELKVQTINQLHFHLFIEDGSGQPKARVAQLNEEDQPDFLDPFSPIVAQLLAPIVAEHVCSSGLKGELRTVWDEFPVGLRITIEAPLPIVMQEPQLPVLLSQVQDRYCLAYNCLASNFLDPSKRLIDRPERIRRTRQFLANTDCLSPLSRRHLLLLSSSVTSSEKETRHHLRFVQGPALTWLFFQQGRQTVVNIAPRILSRGNAMESLGIWKDQFDDAPVSTQCQYNAFYAELAARVDSRYRPRSGPLLNF
ncbi:MAG: hypothetical protein WC686_02915 [Candidatus Shapirobacteria bacterium]|jgi:hypothetical protein